MSSDTDAQTPFDQISPAVPLAAVFVEALRKGVGAYFESFNDPAAWSAIKLTLLAAAVSVPVNIVFGLAASWAIAKFEFVGKSILITLIDLPFAVSPVISGLIFVLVFLNGTEIACSRQADETFTCNTKALLLGRFPMFEREITQIVDVDIFDNGCSDGCSYRAEFITSDGGQVPVNEVYTDYDPVSTQVNDLKSRIGSGNASFEYKIEPIWWVMYLLGGLFLMEAVILTSTMGAGVVREYIASRDQLP